MNNTNNINKSFNFTAGTREMNGFYSKDFLVLMNTILYNFILYWKSVNSEYIDDGMTDNEMNKKLKGLESFKYNNAWHMNFYEMDTIRDMYGNWCKIVASKPSFGSESGISSILLVFHGQGWINNYYVSHISNMRFFNERVELIGRVELIRLMNECNNRIEGRDNKDDKDIAKNEIDIYRHIVEMCSEIYDIVKSKVAGYEMSRAEVIETEKKDKEEEERRFFEKLKNDMDSKINNTSTGNIDNSSSLLL